jgi:hypothetical protein
MDKPKIAVFFFLILIILLVSFKSMIFFTDLVKSSLIYKENSEDFFEVLARNYFRNKRLKSLIKKYSQNDLFLLFVGKEIMKRSENNILSVEYHDLQSKIVDRFPENVYLNYFEYYKRQDSSKDWENFDLFFLKNLEDPSLNSLSYKILVDAVRCEKISKHSLFDIICFLNWKGNFSLVEDLLIWETQEKRMDEVQYSFLYNEMALRKKKKAVNRKSEIDTEELINKVSELTNRPTDKIEMSDNLVLDGEFRDKDSFNKHWQFVDKSDREPFSKGSFYGGMDLFENPNMRLMGFFVKNAHGKAPSNAGFWHKKEIPLQEKLYLFYFKYRTFCGKEKATFWLSLEFEKEWSLEPTAYQWTEVAYIFNNKNFKVSKINPFLRMFGTGSVWFDSIGFFELDLKGTSVEKDILFNQ